MVTDIKMLNEKDMTCPDRLTSVEIYFFVFITGSVIGWFYELFFYLIMENRLSNNGFFFGPYLPIYGFGALLILLSTKRLKRYPLAVFIVTMFVTGILEYFTGLGMYKIWSRRWWDYRNLFMNIGGYVCLRSVITFAFGALALDYFVEPIVRYIGCKVSKRLRNTICILTIIILLADVVATIIIRIPKL